MINSIGDEKIYKEHGRFNDDEIKAIRLDNRYCYIIAREYGCNYRTINAIKRKEIYVHVDPNGPTFSLGSGLIGKFSEIFNWRLK